MRFVRQERPPGKANVLGLGRRITGSNAYAAGRDRLVGEHWDPNSTLLWLENYCSKDPLATFFTAADDFRRALAIQEGVQRKDTP